MKNWLVVYLFICSLACFSQGSIPLKVLIHANSDVEKIRYRWGKGSRRPKTGIDAVVFNDRDLYAGSMVYGR